MGLKCVTSDLRDVLGNKQKKIKVITILRSNDVFSKHPRVFFSHMFKISF